MPDMLVNLHGATVPSSPTPVDGVRIVRALAPDAREVLRFVEDHTADHWPGESPDRWWSECLVAMTNQPPTCFLAVDAGRIIGFACHDATAKGYFGPTGVLREHQGRGIGTALLVTALAAMREAGYGYAVVGSPAGRAVDFYRRAVGARVIEDSSPGIYGRLVDP